MPSLSKNPDQLSFDSFFESTDEVPKPPTCSETRRSMVALLCQAGYRGDYISLYEGNWVHPVTSERMYIYVPCFHPSVLIATRGSLYTHSLDFSTLTPLAHRRLPLLHHLLDLLERYNPAPVDEANFPEEVSKLRNNSNLLYTEECLVFISDCIIKRGSLLDGLDLSKSKIKETLVEQYGKLTYKIKVLQVFESDPPSLCYC